MEQQVVDADAHVNLGLEKGVLYGSDTFEGDFKKFFCLEGAFLSLWMSTGQKNETRWR